MPAQIPARLGEPVARDGSVIFATFDQATLAAAGFTRLGAGEPGRQKVQTSFEQNSTEEQARLSARAKDAAGDQDVALIASLTKDNFSGTLWIPGPGDDFIRQSWTSSLEDGTPAFLAARIELESSTYAFSVTTLQTYSEILAADMFSSTGDSGARLGIMRVVWPHRGRARAIDISVLKEDGKQEATLTEARSYGVRKTRGPDEVDEAAFTARTFDAFREAYE